MKDPPMEYPSHHLTIILMPLMVTFTTIKVLVLRSIIRITTSPIKLHPVLVPKVTNIITQIAADPTMLTIFYPFTAADAKTEPMKCCLIIPIPFKYIPIFLANEVTPRFYFETVLPHITADNNTRDCLALTRHFQLAIVREAPINQWFPLKSVRPSKEEMRLSRSISLN